MRNRTRWLQAMAATVLAALSTPALTANAPDPIVWWNTRAVDIVAGAQVPTPVANRAMAIVATAAYEATNAITRRYTFSWVQLQPPSSDASAAAAIAAAHHVALGELLPAQRAAIEAAYREQLDSLPDNAARQSGIAVGERAARAVLALRAQDGAAAAEQYRPVTAPGVYVPTAIPIVSQWPGRKGWFLSSGAQFRPGPPPKLSSAQWARDYNEILKLGRREGSSRTAEQTAAARFWETTQPAIYHQIVRSLAGLPGRELTRNARLFALVTEAVDDSMIAVFDAKYHYALWRPITAIRNGDLDGNDATTRDASWLPFIDTPMHPEYPCAHCIVSATIATVLAADTRGGPEPLWTSSSPTAGNASRSWKNLDDFVREVSEARIADGVHYRTSTDVAAQMGRQIGMLALKRWGD